MLTAPQKVSTVEQIAVALLCLWLTTVGIIRCTNTIAASPTVDDPIDSVMSVTVPCRALDAESATQQRAWDTICDYAPHVGGQEIGVLEQRAMTQVDAWDMSVEAVDAYCVTRQEIIPCAAQ